MFDFNDRIEKVEQSIIDVKEFSDPFSTQFSKSTQFRLLTERMKEYNIPGVSLAVINDNKLDGLVQYGVTDNVSNQKVEPNTLFQAASTSKLVTAITLLHFVEKEIRRENLRGFIKLFIIILGFATGLASVLKIGLV